MIPSTLELERFRACSATRRVAGMYGTAESSQVFPAWTLAKVWRPRRFAASQLLVARGPGPTAEIEYSPTSVETPPRVMGRDHSLTLWGVTPAGRPLMMGSIHSSGHPQSHTITLAPGLDRQTPSATERLTSRMTSGGERSRQRGHSFPLWCE